MSDDLDAALRRLESRIKSWGETLYYASIGTPVSPQFALAITERLVGLIEAWEVASGTQWPPDGWSHSASVVRRISGTAF